MDLSDNESNFYASLGSDNDSKCSKVKSSHLACIFNVLTLAEIHNYIANVIILS